MKFIPPKGVVQCSNFVKVIMDVFNMYSLMKIEGENAFFSSFLLRKWEEEETRVLFNHILDTDGLPFSEPAKMANINIKMFFQALKLISDWLYNIDLPFISREELGFITLETIKEAVDTFIAFKKEEEADFEGFFTESLKKAMSRL